MTRKCYIAKYPLSADGKDLNEVIMVESILPDDNKHWNREMSLLWDTLTFHRKPTDPMLQAWYADDMQVTCMATTNQPFKLS